MRHFVMTIMRPQMVIQGLFKLLFQRPKDNINSCADSHSFYVMAQSFHPDAQSGHPEAQSGSKWPSDFGVSGFKVAAADCGQIIFIICIWVPFLWEFLSDYLLWTFFCVLIKKLGVFFLNCVSMTWNKKHKIRVSWKWIIFCISWYHHQWDVLWQVRFEACFKELHHTTNS